VDIGAGDQFKPDFLRVSPNNRMPAIVDHEPLGGGKPLSLFESGAILEYLADKTGRFLPRTGAARYAVLQWVHWQMANLGPMMGNANHFKNYAPRIVDDPKQLEYGTRRFVGEVDRLCGVMDAQLSANRHLAGDEYTIADVITWPWAFLLGRLIDEKVWDPFPHLKRWVDEVGARPAVEKGRRHEKEWGERELSEDEQKRRREILFNQTNEKVRAAREAAARAGR
jgi:GST-like protein